MGNCYGCRFALEAREHHRRGEQVRCLKAEELFGGTRWVNVQKDANGNLTDSKCGTFEPFQGDSSTAPEPEKEKVTCPKCKGRGMQVIQFMHTSRSMKCHKCEGLGKVESE